MKSHPKPPCTIEHLAGPDTLRKSLLDRLHRGMLLSTSPGESHAEPFMLSWDPNIAPPKLGVGDPVELLNHIKVTQRYAAALSKACRDPLCPAASFLRRDRELCVGRMQWLSRFSWESDTSLSRFEGVSNWKSRGLRYVIALVAEKMPSRHDWSGKHDLAAWEAYLGKIRGASSDQDLTKVLRGLPTCLDWGSAGGVCVASALDRVAVHLRLHSGNSGTPDLDTLLAEFPSWTEESSLGEIWTCSKSFIEGTFPPSLLCPVMGSGTPLETWGYPSLAPVVDGDAVWFDTKEGMRWVTPIAGLKGAAMDDTLTRDGNACCLGERLRGMLGRLGISLLSPEMGHLMMDALDAKLAKNLSDYNPSSLLRSIPEGAMPRDKVDLAARTFLHTGLPTVARSEAPMAIMAWKVSPPANVILYTSRVKGEVLHDPSTLSKISTDDKSMVKSVMRVAMLPPDTSCLDRPDRLVRADMFHFTRCHPLLFKEKLKSSPDKTFTHTAINEAFYTFSQVEPLIHTCVGIGTQNPWEQDFVDSRYAESQAAVNGTRYRDWLKMHKDDPQMSHMSRLESHVFRCNGPTFSTHFPWKRKDGTTRWCPVMSSVEPSVLVLKEKEEMGNDFVSFTHCIKNRLVHDFRLLPTRSPEDATERRLATCYADAFTRTVLVCYSAANVDQPALEFLAFQMPVA